MSSRASTRSKQSTKDETETKFWCLKGDGVNEKEPGDVFQTVAKDIKNGKEGTVVIVGVYPNNIKEILVKVIDALKPDIKVGCVARLGLITSNRIIVPITNLVLPIGADIKSVVNASPGIEINPYDPTLEVEPVESIMEFMADMYERSGVVTKPRIPDYDSETQEVVDPVAVVAEGLSQASLVLSMEVQALCTPAQKPETLNFPYESISVSSSHLHLLFTGVSIPHNPESGARFVRPQEFSKKAIDAFNCFVTTEARDATYVCGCRKDTSPILDRLGRLLHNKRRTYSPSLPVFYRITNDNALDIKRDMINLSEETKYVPVYVEGEDDEHTLDALTTELEAQIASLEESIATLGKEKDTLTNDLAPLDPFINKKLSISEEKAGPIWTAMECSKIENEEIFRSDVTEFYKKMLENIEQKEREEQEKKEREEKERLEAEALAKAQAEAEAEAAAATAAENAENVENVENAQATTETPAEGENGNETQAPAVAEPQQEAQGEAPAEPQAPAQEPVQPEGGDQVQSGETPAPEAAQEGGAAEPVQENKEGEKVEEQAAAPAEAAPAEETV